ncbi:MAG: hypothetical protein K2H32_07845, partial [Muribaculaceae bacterium]|nr:hypothetical protein [Muribaculaceae bacterium]
IDINEDVNHLIDKLANVILQVYLQVWENTSVNQSAMIADVLRMFISIKTKSQTLSELLKLSNMESLYKLRRYILEPAISAGYIEMSNPEKPTSSKQRYLLTELASNLFNQ